MTQLEEGIRRWRDTPGAILVDLRDPEDYAAGHIDGAVNVQLADLRERMAELAGTDTPILLCCYSGMRSYQAEALLTAMGYTEAVSIGGMDTYRGELAEG